jgi:hypothetical protein
MWRILAVWVRDDDWAGRVDAFGQRGGGLANVHDVWSYMGRGLGSGVNRVFSRISSFRS